jgi:Rv0078B-related antitoxin
MESTVTKLTRAMPNCIETVDADMARVLALKSEGERLKIGWGMWRSARNMLSRLLRAEHPTWTESEIAAEVARRLASGT